MTTKTVNADVVKSQIREFLDIWLTGNIPGLGRFLTDDVVFQTAQGPLPGGEFHGRDAFLRECQGMIPRAITNTKYGEIITKDDFAYVDFTVGGDDSGVPFTKGCDVFYMRGDLIARKDVYLKVQ